MIRTLALVIGSTLLVTPQVAQAKWGAARLARIKQSVTSMPKAFSRIKTGVKRSLAAHRQSQQVKQNIKQLCRASPDLKGAYLQASRSFKKSNRGNLALGASYLFASGAFGIVSATNFVTGNLVLGTAIGVGSGIAATHGGQVIKGHYKGARLAGQRAVMEKLGSSKQIRTQVGGKVLP